MITAISGSTLIEMGRNRSFVDKTAPLDPFYFNSVLVGDALSMEERRKSNGYGRYDASFGLGGIVMRTVTA